VGAGPAGARATSMLDPRRTDEHVRVLVHGGERVGGVGEQVVSLGLVIVPVAHVARRGTVGWCEQLVHGVAPEQLHVRQGEVGADKGPETRRAEELETRLCNQKDISVCRERLGGEGADLVLRDIVRQRLPNVHDLRYEWDDAHDVIHCPRA
jgi:hypothetical protein